MRAFVLGSGSSGNALLVESRASGTRILVDAGVGPRKLEARLALLSPQALLPRGVDAIVPTHHHGDHFAHAERLARALGAPLWLHRGIDASRFGPGLDVRRYAIGQPFRVGDVAIESERVPHDAPQVALRIATKDHALGVALDVGHATRELAALLASCDVAILEANHCAELLAHGDYPERLKRRIAGGYGHLSNGGAAALASRLVGSRLGRLYLAHLSRANNTPERAKDVVASAARRIEVDVLPHGPHGTVASLDLRRARPLQLALPFG